jgi:hypothetical protein
MFIDLYWFAPNHFSRQSGTCLNSGFPNRLLMHSGQQESELPAKIELVESSQRRLPIRD